MSVSLRIPCNLQGYCEGRSAIDLEGARVGDLLREMQRRYPELALRVLDEGGALRSHLVVIRKDRVLARKDLAQTRVSEGDDLRIFTAVSGG